MMKKLPGLLISCCLLISRGLHNVHGMDVVAISLPTQFLYISILNPNANPFGKKEEIAKMVYLDGQSLPKMNKITVSIIRRILVV